MTNDPNPPASSPNGPARETPKTDELYRRKYPAGNMWSAYQDVLDLARQFEIALAETAREREQFKDAWQLATHKCLTCGVAAIHPDANLTLTGAYKAKWDSPQAQSVRDLRSALTAAEEKIAELERVLQELVRLIELKRRIDRKGAHRLRPTDDEIKGWIEKWPLALFAARAALPPHTAPDALSTQDLPDAQG